MTKYVRLCKTVNTRGKLVPLDSVNAVEKIKNVIKNNSDSDWYTSLYYYNEEAKTYFDKNQSIKGYSGTALTNKLFFDIDYENDLEQAKKDAIEVLNRLIRKGVGVRTSAIVYFSGNKGFHIELPISTELKPNELKIICSNIAKGLKSFDPAVYDTVRLVRLTNTKHQKSGLYKICMSASKFYESSIEDIKEMAKAPKMVNPVKSIVEDIKFLDEFREKIKPKPQSVIVSADDDEEIKGLSSVNFEKCPPHTPRCIYALQQGIMQPGERGYLFFRLANYYRNQGLSQGITHRILKGIAELNSTLYPDADPITKEEIWTKHIASAYSKQSNFKQIPGATGISKDNELLHKYCNASGKYTEKNCIIHGKTKSSVVKIDDVFGSFSKFAEGYDKNRIETGINFIDKYMHIATGTVSLLAGACGCHRKGEKVLMYDGSTKKVENVQVGDKLMGPNSTPRVVLQLKHGTESMYKVTFDKGKVPKNKPKYFNENHILHFLDCNKGERVVQLTIKDYIEKYPNWRKSRNYFLRQPVDFKEQKVSIDPYFLGCWLGDGSQHQLAITTVDEEIKNYIHDIAKNYKLKISNIARKQINKAPTYLVSSGFMGGNRNKNILWNFFKELNLKNNKHIPPSYITNSRNIRLELLAGLIDTDGHIHNNVIEITQKRKNLILDIQKLCFSLGFQATLKKRRQHSQNGTIGTYYRLHISGNLEEIPTKLKRKKLQKRNSEKNVSHLSFNIEKINEAEEYFGFTVDRDNLYLDDDFLIIRNSGKTSLALNLLANANANGIACMFFSLDMHKNLLVLKLARGLTDYTQEEIIKFFKNKDEAKKKEISDAIKAVYSKTFFDFSGTLTMENMRDKILTTNEKSGQEIKLVIVDYASRVSGPHSDRYSNATYNALRSKEMASDTDAAWVFISQISRNAGDGSSPLRTKRAAKESGDWEEAASNVITMWRPFMGCGDEDDVMRLFLAKNRMGREVEQPLWWSGEKGRVFDMTYDELSKYREFREEREIEVFKNKFSLKK